MSSLASSSLSWSLSSLSPVVLLPFSSKRVRSVNLRRSTSFLVNRWGISVFGDDRRAAFFAAHTNFLSMSIEGIGVFHQELWPFSCQADGQTYSKRIDTCLFS